VSLFDVFDVRTCTGCGCTDDLACWTDGGPCCSVGDELCSGCIELPADAHQRAASSGTGAPDRGKQRIALTTGAPTQLLVRGFAVLRRLPRLTAQLYVQHQRRPADDTHNRRGPNMPRALFRSAPASGRWRCARRRGRGPDPSASSPVRRDGTVPAVAADP